MGPNLDPGIQTYIKLANELFDEDDGASIEEQRQAYLELCNAFARPHPEGVKALDRTIKAAGIEIPLRIYRPAASGALPAVLFFHGGGWVLGDLDSHDSIAADICSRTGAIVIAVHYRLAPEHPFPAAFDDCYAALCHAAAHAGDFGLDPARIVVCGDSAGGNLAAVVCLDARDRGGPPLALQLLIYPSTDMGLEQPSHFTHAEQLPLRRPTMQWFVDHYLRGANDQADWRASPLRAGSFEKLPPTLVVTAGFDPLCDEGEAYAMALANAGVEVAHERFAGQIHGFLSMGRMVADSDRLVRMAAAALRRAYESG